jgi:hypothetical protein
VLAESTGFDVVVLVLIDGLGFDSVRCSLEAHPVRDVRLEPCLVDGPTVTAVAFPRVIGEPPLALRLFDEGFERRQGFTYWTRQENALTDLLFRTVPDVGKQGDFQTILCRTRAFLSGSSGSKAYIQILRAGLDGFSHHSKRKPPAATITAEIIKEMIALASLLDELGCSACVFLTSDHGILWRDEIDFQVVGHAPAGSSPRCCTWQELYSQSEPGRRFVVGKQEFFCLGVPLLRRPLRIDEQGVHGGISFQESVVPFLLMKVGEPC